MLKDYNFIKKDTEFIAHLARHFKSDFPGSVFTWHFRNPEEIIEFALEQIKFYDGKTTVFEIDVPEQIGLDSVIPLADLPPGAKISKEIRDGLHEVNVVYGIKRTPTKHLVIVVGPLPPNGEQHGFLSIYPGKACPPIEDKEFWDKHAFIKS